MKDALKAASSPRIWLHGLVAAIIGGAAGGAQEALHHGITEHNISWQTVGTSALTGAILFGVGYLIKSPLFTLSISPDPPESTPDTTTK